MIPSLRDGQQRVLDPILFRCSMISWEAAVPLISGPKSGAQTSNRYRHTPFVNRPRLQSTKPVSVRPVWVPYLRTLIGNDDYGVFRDDVMINNADDQLITL